MYLNTCIETNFNSQFKANLFKLDICQNTTKIELLTQITRQHPVNMHNILNYCNCIFGAHIF